MFSQIEAIRKRALSADGYQPAVTDIRHDGSPVFSTSYNPVEDLRTVLKELDDALQELGDLHESSQNLIQSASVYARRQEDTLMRLQEQLDALSPVKQLKRKPRFFVYGVILQLWFLLWMYIAARPIVQVSSPVMVFLILMGEIVGFLSWLLYDSLTATDV